MFTSAASLHHKESDYSQLARNLGNGNTLSVYFSMTKAAEKRGQTGLRSWIVLFVLFHCQIKEVP